MARIIAALSAKGHRSSRPVSSAASARHLTSGVEQCAVRPLNVPVLPELAASLTDGDAGGVTVAVIMGKTAIG